MGRPDRVGIRTVGGWAGALLLLLASCADSPPTPPPPEAADGPLLDITRPAETGSVRFVRLVQRGNQYAFEPDSLELAPGDVLRFVMVDAQPESIVFDPSEATPEVASFIRAHSLEMGVLLTDPGQTYDVSFADAPPGRYPFASLPHPGTRGVVRVGES